MDTTRELYERDATGWRAGLYDDIKHTLRAPVVNWIFRTLTANHPAFARYLWGQVKPVFQTAAFGAYATRYRDAVLTPLEARTELPAHTPSDLGVSPEAHRELQAQLATFDVVIPRLAALFDLAHRALTRDLNPQAPSGRDATAPLPAGFDRGRGRPPTMILPDAIPPRIGETADDIRTFHGLDDGLPSVYRCLFQWPPATKTIWRSLEPHLTSSAFDRATTAARDATTDFVDATPHRPRLDPAALETAGFEPGTIDDVTAVFAEFNRGAIETVLPAVPAIAHTVDATGPRSPPHGAP